MKKFIYTLILLAGVQFAQAQEILGIYTANYVPWEQVYFDTLSSPGGSVTIIVGGINSGDNATAIAVGDTMFFDVTLHGNRINAIYYAPTREIGVDSIFGVQMSITLLTKYMWVGDNELCVDITSVSIGGVRRNVGNSYCAIFDVRNIENPDNSISEASILGAMEIYPNPVNDQLKIRNAAEAVSVEIYSITGQLVKTTEVVGDADIDMSNVANGVYVVKMRNGKQIRTEKIQVVK
ncbi:MAG: T9SS type A sorting domain-containing protein [Bacteroidales bacterium]|jgi:hypothetical protein|nr:T9SS type A sorting domain-containing protein [Bacteroidales bacterium]